MYAGVVDQDIDPWVMDIDLLAYALDVRDQ